MYIISIKKWVVIFPFFSETPGEKLLIPAHFHDLSARFHVLIACQCPRELNTNGKNINSDIVKLDNSKLLTSIELVKAQRRKTLITAGFGKTQASELRKCGVPPIANSSLNRETELPERGTQSKLRTRS